LNVHDFRDFLGLSIERITDERLFEIMHETRARSKYVPEEIRQESKIWLAHHREDD
jgi:hypothetical protein